MSFASKKPLIKQQTVYNGEEKPKSKMSLSTKRVSFNSTTIQSDSDEENSLGRSNRRPVKKPNGDDDDLLNMFRNELSESDDDLETGFEVKRKDKPSPVPRHSRSNSSRETKHNDILITEPKSSKTLLENQSIDHLEQTINPKARPRPQPRKITCDSQSEEGSPRTSKPEVTPRVKPSKGRPTSAVLKSKPEFEYSDGTEHRMDRSGRRKFESRNELSDSDDGDITVGSGGTMNDKVTKARDEFERYSSIKMGSGKLKKGSSEENKYGDKNRQHIEIHDSEQPYSLRQRQEGSSSQKTLDKGKYRLLEEDKIINSDKETKPYQSESMKKNLKKFGRQEEITKSEKKSRGMVPAPRPRNVQQDGLRVHKSKEEHEYDSENNTESDDEAKKNVRKTPVPKARKEHFTEVQEKEIVPKSILSKSKLYPLDDSGDDDVDDYDNNNTHERIGYKRNEIHLRANDGPREDEMDGSTRKENTLDWSSLDESDDDEAVGKKVSLFKKQRPSSAKATENNDDREINKMSKPKPPPRPKPRRELDITEQLWQNDTSKKKDVYEDLKSSKYDSYQRVPKERGDKERARPSTPSRTATPQRPGSSKKRNDPGWSRENGDITDMFEEHIPETSHVIGGDDVQWRHRKEHSRPPSSFTPKRGPMKADRGIEEMTRSPHLRQTLAHDYDEWDYPAQRGSLGKQKSSSLTNLNRTGGSECGDHYDEHDGPRRNSLDTETIRQTVYNNWLSRKNVTIKKELSKKALQKQEEEKKKKEEEERRRSAELAFKSWNKSKTGTLKEQHAKMKAKQKEEHDKDELEKKMKEKDSKKYFESWKGKKDEILKEVHKEKKKEITLKKKKEKEETLDKTISSKKCFENWKSKKDTILKQQLKEKKKNGKLEESKKEDEGYEKTIKNADEFEKWVEKKGMPRRGPPPPKLSQRAWVPGSRHTGDCIPTAVQPVILPPSSNRARTMSGTYRGKTKYYDF